RYYNSGDYNSGSCNSGYRNSGHYNSGKCNSGYHNSGNYNRGSWNSCNKETGSFNTIQSKTIRIFNKDCDVDVWTNANKPNFLYFDLTEYKDDKLTTFDYKEAFQKSFDNCSNQAEQIELLKALPNFDADVFFEISGIRIK
ncbi:MAG: pentapeptide repeat-containing protein, partial [Candidatus Kariarchaeaceae archaeon]